MTMIYESPYNDSFSIPSVDITGLILEHNLKGSAPNKPAIIDGYTGDVVYTYESLRDSIKRYAGFLQQKLSIRKGDVVAFLSFNTTHYPIVVHAILATGGTLSAFNPAYRPEEIAHSLKLAKPKFVLVESGLESNLENGIKIASKDIQTPSIHMLDGDSTEYPCHHVRRVLSMPRDEFPLRRIIRSPEEISSDLAFICFSSGTSGLVKGVKLSHGNVVANVLQQGRCLEDMFTPQTVFTLVVPFYHILGLGGFCIQYLCHGAPIVVFRSFELPKMLTSISRDRVTHINVVPPIALAILQSPLTSKADLSSVKCLMNAAAPLKQALADELRKLVGGVVTQWYGMTEASPSVISQRESEANRPNTIGRLLPSMQMRVVDENGSDVAQGKPGELWIRGPNLMLGYVNQTSEVGAVTPDGFFPTGDVGFVDEDGYVFLVDRLKELIKVKGHQVAPAELEAILLSHPAVVDAAVCGVHVEDEATEYPIAYIVAKGHSEKPEMLSEDVRKFVDGQVAHYKRLQGGVHIIESIPKIPSGKILRRCLPAKVNRSATEAAVAALRKKVLSKL